MSGYEQLVRTAHGVAQNTYHMIWVTKYRAPILRTATIASVARNAITLAAKRYGLELFELEVMPDHVHVFTRLPRSMSIERAFHLLKGYSSYQMRRIIPGWRKYNALWSPFTFSRTVGSVTGGVIEHYIKQTNTKGYYGNQRSILEFGSR